MKRSAVVARRDMLHAIDAVCDMTDGTDFIAYSSYIKLRIAVERGVKIVSEASRRIAADKAGFPDVPWPEIAAIGDGLHHEYPRLDDLIPWKVATRELPDLRPTIITLHERVGGR